MKNANKLTKKVIKFALDNYVISLFLIIVALVGVIILYKIITAKKETVYVKVKVSQGLWWASTLKPAYWMVESLHKGDVEKSLTGKTVAEIVERRSYPLGIWSSEQYDTFLIVKLYTDYNSRTGKYIFKRNPVTVGAPIDFEFVQAQVSGTVYGISSKLFNDQYETRVVTVQKNYVTQFEYEGIQIGDKYFDGKDNVLEIIDKSFEYTYDLYSSLGNNYPLEADRAINIKFTLKMKLQKKDNMYFFREELPIQSGRKISFQTNSLFFDQYNIFSIK